MRVLMALTMRMLASSFPAADSKPLLNGRKLDGWTWATASGPRYRTALGGHAILALYEAFCLGAPTERTPRQDRSSPRRKLPETREEL